MVQEVPRAAVDAAEVYDRDFVPALFEQWPERVMDAARVQPGDRVLDVACGTGALTRAVARRIGPNGRAVGLDINPAMLAVAARRSPGIEWRQSPAESLPFRNETFDAVVSQYGLMFITDRAGALREMARVLTPGRHIAVAVWDTLENNTGYAALIDLLERLFGQGFAEPLRAPFSLGSRSELARLFSDAGIPSATITTHTETARFASLDAWLHINVRNWAPVGEKLSEDQFRTLRREAALHLQPAVDATGAAGFPLSTHIVSALRKDQG